MGSTLNIANQSRLMGNSKIMFCIFNFLKYFMTDFLEELSWVMGGDIFPIFQLLHFRHFFGVGVEEISDQLRKAMNKSKSGRFWSGRQLPAGGARGQRPGRTAPSGLLGRTAATTCSRLLRC